MRVQRRQTLDFATEGLAAKVRLALARLTDADEHVRRAVTEVNALLESGPKPSPVVLSQALRTLDRAAEEMRRAETFSPPPIGTSIAVSSPWGRQW